MSDQKIGFIGAGQMAMALAKGFVAAGLVRAENLLAADPSEAARAAFAEATGGTTLGSNTQVVSQTEVIVLAVKPHLVLKVADEVRQTLTPEKLVVSIAAGIRTAALEEALTWSHAFEGVKQSDSHVEGVARLVRVMPNTPCLVGRGACGYCLGKNATAEDGRLIEQLLSSVGLAFEVEERLLDAVTGLSGSGPAFIYQVIEALSDGGVRMGLPRNIATALAAQTVAGAAEMVTITGEHPGVLKDRVTSPGGTTIAGIQALEEHGLRAALMAAVGAATERSLELARTS